MSTDRQWIASVEIEIPFHDVDSVNIVWHGHYAKYLEIARCRLLESFDYNYPQMRDSGYVWPVIDIRLRYVAPARFQQLIRVDARLDEWEHRLKISYVIYDALSGKRITKGYSVQVAVDADTGEMQLVSPNILYQKLGLGSPE
ncbi:acyl-CoA thioesterase [Porticoccaceae bacterium]|nr:acyl-CoA thioesterase [Porticoccaceae bacterium]